MTMSWMLRREWQCLVRCLCKSEAGSGVQSMHRKTELRPVLSAWDQPNAPSQMYSQLLVSTKRHEPCSYFNKFLPLYLLQQLIFSLLCSLLERIQKAISGLFGSVLVLQLASLLCYSLPAEGSAVSLPIPKGSS